MNIHPVAEIFPRMPATEFAALKLDIAERGLREAVWTKDGAIIDGRHRWRACEELGVECPVREYEGADLVAFVVSLNLRRRHLDESQRAMVAASLANLGEGRHSATASNEAVSQANAAQMLNVSRSAVQRAAAVREAGVPELVSAVQDGLVSVSAAADVATLAPEDQAEVVARGEREILLAAKEIRARKADDRRAERVAKIVEISKGNGVMAEGSYPVIYCDPPWRYDYIETESRAIENQYPTMSIDEIKGMALGDIAADDCVLFMWATSPKLADAMEVLTAWGFVYRTCAVWDKQVIGMGYYFRQQHELLLVATKGNPVTPSPANRPSSVVSVKRGEHSRKPDEFYALIENMYPEFAKVELFARGGRAGWSAWGNQAVAA